MCGVFVFCVVFGLLITASVSLLVTGLFKISLGSVLVIYLYLGIFPLPIYWSTGTGFKVVNSFLDFCGIL